MSIKKHTITIETSNVNANNSYINCYSIGNIVFVEGCVKTKKNISTYTGLGIAKTFPSPKSTKNVVYFQPCSTDGIYASIMPGIGQDGWLSFNARNVTITANTSSYINFCYICK